MGAVPAGTVSELWRFPVKSMAGERVEALRVDGRGAAGDRTHAVWFVHRRGPRWLTAREAPRLLAWRAGYAADGAALAPEAPPTPTLVAPDGARAGWDDAGLAERLSADLERPVSLRRDVGGQQDLERSLLVTTRATHAALEAELGARIDPRRWRTNLHLELDAPAWAELGWEGGRIELEGGVVLRLLHPCERCVIPTRDPDTQAKWPELLKHLVAEHGMRFGINARVETPGTVREGEGATVASP